MGKALYCFILLRTNWDIVCIFLCRLLKEEKEIGKKGERSGHTIHCENCGKEVYQTKTQYNRAKHHYCSNNCQRANQRKYTHEDRKCEICENYFYVSKKSTKRFCSVDCQKKWQKTNTGFANPNFQGKEITCEWCKKKYVVGKTIAERYGHHFCSKECREEWYRNVYSQSEEWREESRIRAVKILERGVIGKTNTKPQILINDLLDDMRITFVNEKGYKYYCVDNYLNEYNLIIEVMGDFWHCSPLKYKSVEKTIHKKVSSRDKAKHTYIKKYFDIEILYLWENDINNNIDVCKELIYKYISNQGILDNYNSFNYELINEELILKDNIVYPYFSKSSA